MPPKSKQPPAPEGDGLRARVRKRKAAATVADGPVEFGVAQANAYFNARRIKRGGSARRPAAKRREQKQQKPESANTNSSNAQHQQPTDDSDESDEQQRTLVLPPHALMLAALRAADDREAARRSLAPAHALPTFEQVHPLSRNAGSGVLGCELNAIWHTLGRYVCSTSRSGVANCSQSRTCSSTASAPSSRCCRCACVPVTHWRLRCVVSSF